MQDKTPKIQLMARDGDDIVVLSALLQDAIIPGADMVFDRKLNEFVIVANRFCWELEPLFDVKSSDGKPIYERHLCGIRFDTGLDHRQQAVPAWRLESGRRKSKTAA